MQRETIDSPRNFSPKKPKRRISRIIEKQLLVPRIDIKSLSPHEIEPEINEINEIKEDIQNINENNKNNAENLPLSSLSTTISPSLDSPVATNDVKFQIPLLDLSKYEGLKEQGFLSEFLLREGTNSSNNSPHCLELQKQVTEGNNSPLPKNETNQNNNEEISEERKKTLTEKRRKVAIELLKTEKTYVQNLNDLYRVFYEPMSANASGAEENRKISMEDVRHIFSSLRVIIKINTMLLESLSQRVDVPDDVDIVLGDIFLTQVCFFHYYYYFIYIIIILIIIIIIIIIYIYSSY